MATAPYNQRPTTFADLLAGRVNAPPYPVDIPQPPQAPGQDNYQSGILTPQQRSSLLEQLLSPPAEAPQAPDEKASAGATVASSFADAFNNIASIYAGQNLRTNYLDEYFNSLQRRNAEKKLQARQTADRAQATQERRASFLLSADERARQKADEAAGRKELKQMQIDQQKAQQQQQLDEFNRAKELQQQQITAQQQFEKEMQNARLAHDTAIEKIHERQRQGDKVAAQDDAKIAASKTYIATLAENLDAILQADPNIAKVETRARRFFDQQNMSKDARDAVDAYYKQEILPLLVEKQNAQLAGGSPQAPPPGTPFGFTGPNPTAAVPALLEKAYGAAIDAIGPRKKR